MNRIHLISTNQPDVYQVQLSLEFENRYIGKLDVSGEGTFTTSRKPQHIFRKNNSLGINYSLLTDDKIFFKWIVINYESGKLITTRDFFLTHGKCFKFQNQGYELQCFLPMDKFGITQARYFEARQCIQQSLFPVM